MKRFHVSRPLLAMLIGVIAVPTVMTGYIRTQVPSANGTQFQEIYRRAAGDVRRVRDLRRDYWEAIAVYNDLREIEFNDFELIPPDVNDRESINFYLDSSNFDGTAVEGLHSAAPDVTARDEYNRLSERYRDFLDGYIATGYCPPTLKQYHLSGLYSLCTRLIDDRIAAIQPDLIQRSEQIRRSSYKSSYETSTLKDRLRMLETTLLKSTQGGVLRPTGAEGQTRPRLDIVE